MASFEQQASVDEDERQFQKFPIRRLEPSIKKFLKVIQIDLQRLHQHRQNMEKFVRIRDVASLNTEQINATRTVQQIKANVHEIEKSRWQVVDEDLSKFDEKIQGMKQAALESVKEFTCLGQSDTKECTGVKELHHTQSRTPDTDRHPLMDGWPSQEDPESELDTLTIQQDVQVAESWEGLQESLAELNVMIHQFSSTVQGQQEKIDRIEDNIEQAQISVQEGTSILGQAAKYKSAMIPVAGAVLGTVLLGPVGAIAGAKLGGLAAFGGGTVGFIGGRVVKKRRDTVTEVELKNLSEKRSNSESDVSEVQQSDQSWYRCLPWKQSETDKK